MTGQPLKCWKCGCSLDDVPLPLSRYAECPGCRAELYVCRMCRFYDPGVAQSCREPMAEEVKDKTRANFCDYLEPRPDAWRPDEHDGSTEAERRLEELFGGNGSEDRDPEAESADPGSALESLFGETKKPQD